MRIRKVENKDIDKENIGAYLTITIPVGPNYIKIGSSVNIKIGATKEEIEQAIKTQEALFWELYEKQIETIKKVKKRLLQDLKD